MVPLIYLFSPLLSFCLSLSFSHPVLGWLTMSNFVLRFFPISVSVFQSTYVRISRVSSWWFSSFDCSFRCNVLIHGLRRIPLSSLYDIHYGPCLYRSRYTTSFRYAYSCPFVSATECFKGYLFRFINDSRLAATQSRTKGFFFFFYHGFFIARLIFFFLIITVLACLIFLLMFCAIIPSAFVKQPKYLKLIILHYNFRFTEHLFVLVVSSRAQTETFSWIYSHLIFVYNGSLFKHLGSLHAFQVF